MSGLIAKVTMFFGSRLPVLLRRRLAMLARLRFRPACSGCGAVWRDIAMPNVVSASRAALICMSTGMFVPVLPKGRTGLEEKSDEKS